MRRPPRHLLALLACAVALLAIAPATSVAAVPTIAIVDPITDNYKASYNADPSQPELRTWLAIRRIEVSGTTWQPVVPDAISVVAGGSVDVVAADGRRGRLEATVTSGPFGSPLWRMDPASAASAGRWGILATVTDRATLAQAAAVVRLTLWVGTEQFGTGVIEYRYDRVLANVPEGHIEYNGPGGRWYVGGVATRTQEEPAPSVAPTLLATPALVRPRITRLTLPRRTMKRTIAMTVRGRAGSPDARISHVRVRVGSASRWGRWIRVRAKYSIVLPSGRAAHQVSVQLRDVRGVTSGVVARRVTCLCG